MGLSIRHPGLTIRPSGHVSTGPVAQATVSLATLSRVRRSLPGGVDGDRALESCPLRARNLSRDPTFRRPAAREASERARF